MCNLRCHTCGQWGDNGYLLGKSLKELKRREVPAERYKNFVDDLQKQGLAPMAAPAAGSGAYQACILSASKVNVYGVGSISIAANTVALWHFRTVAN